MHQTPCSALDRHPHLLEVECLKSKLDEIRFFETSGFRPVIQSQIRMVRKT